MFTVDAQIARDQAKLERETDPPVIFLGPRCQVITNDEGRLWCEDPQPCDDDTCPHKPVKYIRADLVETFNQLLAAAESALKRLEKGAPGWGVAKDELRAAIAAAKT